MSQHLSVEPQCNPSLPGARSQPRAGGSNVLSARKRERKGLREEEHLSHPQITQRSHSPQASRKAIPSAVPREGT